MAIAKGLPLKAACKLAGLGFTTFNGWREEDSLFAQEVEFAEAQAIERNLALIQRSALKDWKAAHGDSLATRDRRFSSSEFVSHNP